MKDIVRNWLKQAEHDLKTAEYNLKGGILDAATFYAQQTTEKGLKAIYIENTDNLIKIHELVKLCELVGAPEYILSLCKEINPVYFEDRYPDFSESTPMEKYSKREAGDIVEKAKTVLKWIKEKLN